MPTTPAAFIRLWRDNVTNYFEYWIGQKDSDDFSRALAQATALTRAVMTTFGEDAERLIQALQLKRSGGRNEIYRDGLSYVFQDWRVAHTGCLVRAVSEPVQNTPPTSE